LFTCERLKQRKSDVDRLIILRFGAGDISRQRSNGRRARRNQKFFAGNQSCGISSGQPAHRDRFNIALDAGNLSGEEDVWMRAHLHGWPQDARAVDVGIAMNLSELEKLCPFESRNRAQNSRLFAVTQMILKSDHAVRVSNQVFLTQLDSSVRLAASTRIDQSDRFHWPKT